MLKRLSVFLVIIYVLAISGCQPGKNDGFAIYLLARDVPAAALSQTDIDRLVLESKPVISADDIISYDRTGHVLDLTQAAYDRLGQLFSTSVRVSGLPFVVCVGKERIYTGAFWTPISSISYDGVVIMQPHDTQGTTVQIALGYPGPDFFKGLDLRADDRIMRALEHTGKLK
jgi:hypothetical protein